MISQQAYKDAMKICHYCKKSIEDDEYNMLITGATGSTVCVHQKSMEATFTHVKNGKPPFKFKPVEGLLNDSWLIE